MKTKIKKIFTKKNFVWFALLLIIIISIIAFSFFINKNKVIIKKHDMYYYTLGIKFELKGKIVIDKDSDNITQLTLDDDNSVFIDSTPLYYKDELKTLFPENMSVIFPLTGKQKKANYYSVIYNDVGDLYLKDRSYKSVLKNAVLYDGDNLYYFIDRMTVSFDDKKYELNPMSYIVVDNINDVLYIYNYDMDEILEFTNLTSDVIISTDNYKINATLDVLYFGDGSRLLFRDVSKLSNIK